MLWDRYRYAVALVGLFGLVSVCSNYVVINFTFICMKNDLSKTITDGNQTRSAFDYTPNEKKYVIWAVAAGTITGTFPVNYFFVRFGARWPFFVAGLISAISTAFIPTAASFSFLALLFARFLQGIAFAADFAAIGLLTVRWSPLTETAILLSVLTCFTSLSSVVTNSISGALCESLGWRIPFYVHAAAGVVVFLLWFVVYRDAPQKSNRVSEKELKKIQKNKSEQHIQHKGIVVPYNKLLTSPVVLTIWLNAFAEMSVIMFLNTYAPIFFNRVLKFEVAETGYLIAVCVFVQVPMKILGGVLSDKAKCFSEHTKMIFFNTIAVGVAGVLMFVLAYVPASHHYIAVVVFTLIFTCLSFNCAGFYKCATLHTRQFAHVVIAMIQWMKSVALITAPALVAAVVKHEDDAAQWRIVLFVLGGIMIVANFLSYFVFTDQPAEWTMSDASKEPTVVFEKEKASIDELKSSA